jgi:REP element-mobilizing transposase RayT
MSGNPPSSPLYWPQRRLQGFNYHSTDHVYFVTMRARTGTTPFTDPALAEMCLASRHWRRADRGVELYAFCLMPDHLHLLLRLTDARRDLGHVIGAFKSFTTTQSWKKGWKGVLWQPRFYDHIVRGEEDARTKARYIVANPERKGLVAQGETYPYCGWPDPL